jgi:hypothetical protein
MSKELIKRAIVHASESEPVDFNKQLSAAMQDKLKTSLGEFVKQKEQEVFKNLK